MTTAPDVAVVATQLAQTDRRALSQAWYSALHLVHDAPGAPARGPRPLGTTFPRPAVRTTAARTHAAPVRANVAAPRSRSGAPAPGLPLERRGPLTPATRRVERVVAALARGPRPRASQTVAIDGGRVRLLVRSDDRATRVVAVCSPLLQPAVERALAHARFALASRGIVVAGA